MANLCFKLYFFNLVAENTSMHTTASLNDIQFALAQKYLSNDVITEYECMRSQDEVMNNIKQLLEKKKHSEHSYDLANI